MGWFWTSSTASPGEKPAEAAHGLPLSTSACPVDHKTRQVWLSEAKTQRETEARSAPASIPVGESCGSSRINHSEVSPHSHPDSQLGTHRQVSSIPRAIPDGSSAPSPANNEQETGSDKSSGNWIYPSEQMFFSAMRRKSHDPKKEDMRTIVPIHNAVNERAWKEIKEWEKGRGSEACGGPKLVSFSGNSTALTPRARLNTLLGYQAPFDRHDWVVDRCGKRIEYVIDFYSGKDEGRPGKTLNFYLDVRPKLNSLEGCKMRLERLVGF